MKFDEFTEGTLVKGEVIFKDDKRVSIQWEDLISPVVYQPLPHDEPELKKIRRRE